VLLPLLTTMMQSHCLMAYILQLMDNCQRAVLT
jgi:hypothetical protein